MNPNYNFNAMLTRFYSFTYAGLQRDTEAIASVCFER